MTSKYRHSQITSINQTQTRLLICKEFTPICGVEPSTPRIDGTLELENLFSNLAIESTSKFSYVFSDGVDGYYQGHTYGFSSSGNYRHSQGWYLGQFASFVNGNINDKTQASKARLMPFGIEHHYVGTSSVECLSLLQGQRLACLTITSESKQSLAILPELNILVNASKPECIDDVLIYEINDANSVSEEPRFIAISANQSVIAKEMATDECATTSKLMGLSDSNIKLMISSTESTQKLVIYLYFESTKTEAIKGAQLAAQNHANIIFQNNLYRFLTRNYLWTNDLEYNRAVMWSRLASRTFVNQEFGSGIWAGLPWFKDCWGRDTFIALSGTSLINGQFSESRAIIENFASMQMQDHTSVNYGRIPNRVTSKTDIIYNTTDGTPWMIREVMEYINYSGDIAFAKDIYPIVKRFIDGIESNYLSEDGLLKHRHPDTWMDAKIKGQIPWSPRGPKANDIQALLFESFHVAARLAEMNKNDLDHRYYLKLAEKLKMSFIRKFWDEDKKQLADHLKEFDIPDNSVRPNQLMVLSIPQTEAFLPLEIGQFIIRNSIDRLLFPWGICSLEQYHEDFHPYHDNRSEYHKDAAYHNGTIWGWNAGFTVSALTSFSKQDLAFQLSKNLAKQILQQGHRGTMSENLDAYQHDEDNLIETGTYAQAWSVSEYARNAQQDYLGFKPELSKNKINLSPKLPSCWTSFSATLPYGQDENLYFNWQCHDGKASYMINPRYLRADLILNLILELGNYQINIECDLTKKVEIILDVNTDDIKFNRNDIIVKKVVAPSYPELSKLKFTYPNWHLTHNSLKQNDYLQTKRHSQNLQKAVD